MIEPKSLTEKNVSQSFGLQSGLFLASRIVALGDTRVPQGNDQQRISTDDGRQSMIVARSYLSDGTRAAVSRVA